MTKSEIKNLFVETLEEQLKKQGCTFIRRDVPSTNRVKDTLSVVFPGNNTSPSLNLDDIAAHIEDMGGNTKNVIDQLVNEYTNMLQNMKKECTDLSQTVSSIDKDYILKNITCAVVSTEKNESLLQEVPFQVIGDLSVILRCNIGNKGSFVIKDDFCKKYSLDSEELFSIAKTNMIKENYVLMDIGNLLNTMALEMGMPIEGMDDYLHETQSIMYVLTNKNKLEGAAFLAIPEVLQAVSEQLGDNYYILPSSRHELILLPEKAVLSTKELHSMVKEVNSTVLEADDYLSDNVFYYDQDTRQLSIMEEEKEYPDLD